MEAFNKLPKPATARLCRYELNNDLAAIAFGELGGFLSLANRLAITGVIDHRHLRSLLGWRSVHRLRRFR